MRLTICSACGGKYEGRRCPCKGQDPRATRAHRRRRAELLEGDPMCHWCGVRPATRADHVVPLIEGGDPDGPMVPACARCDSSRGGSLATADRRSR